MNCWTQAPHPESGLWVLCVFHIVLRVLRVIHVIHALPLLRLFQAVGGIHSSETSENVTLLLNMVLIPPLVEALERKLVVPGTRDKRLLVLQIHKVWRASAMDASAKGRTRAK